MQIMTQDFEASNPFGPIGSERVKKVPYSILAPMGIKAATAIINNNKNQMLLLSMLRDRLFYVSHPSLSTLECSINLNALSNKEIEPQIFFEQTVEEILKLANFNLKQIETKNKTFSLLFKDATAMKLLNIIFKDQQDHPLYPIYLNWIEGSEWMSRM
jgi:hypothetical protein